jgi:hypothetical protein
LRLRGLRGIMDRDRLYRKLKKLDRKIERLESKVETLAEKRLGLRGHRKPKR